MQLRCTNCETVFDGEPNARCPKCLRVTSVQVVGEEAAGEDGGARKASWPAGTSCPLCLERDVSDRPEAIFYFELARELAKGAPWTVVRCRCCDECRLRVEGLATHRKIAAPFVAVGVLAAAAGLFADGPLVKVGFTFPTSIFVGFALAIVIAGIPLYIVDRGNRALRRHLEVSWLFRKVKASVTAAEKDGFMSEDQWKVLPDVSEKTKAEALKAEDLVKDISGTR